MKLPEKPEITLDPQDWSRLRDLGHRMIDDVFRYLETVRDREVWKPIPSQVRDELDSGRPLEPRDPEQVYADFQRLILPYPTGNIHPRFWGWVIGSGTPFGMLAQLLEGVMNCNVFGADQVAVEVERQVIGWFKEAMGYLPEASGILTTGGSASNLVGLTVARNAKAEADIAAEGIQSLPRRMVLYASAETHSSVRKSVELLGLGSHALRMIPVDADFRIRIELLREAIRQDREAGLLPFCVVGNAGTVNTGAFDPLEELADLCRDEDLWLHVDGALGGFAVLSDRLKPLVRGIERADSLALDLHKWLHVQYDAGCVLIRRPHDHHAAYTRPASYLNRAQRGLSGGPLWFNEYGFELSRGFRALRIWMALQEHGFRRYGELVEQNVRQAAYLAGLVADSENLELLAPVPLNVVCFRHTVPGWDEPALAAFNQALLADLQENGVAAPSSTVLNGRFALRVAICNHRSRFEDFVLLVKEVLRLGRERILEAQPAGAAH
ncbi:MAG TPA: aminotransferase class V-fold PLP-dependent enzyme [Terriglobales bacterium]|nr:aminotransferase class V-fold PLP-dependent enzyme [Terriglobales bacterium]